MWSYSHIKWFLEQINVPRITNFFQSVICYYPINMGDFRELFNTLGDKRAFASGRTLHNPLTSPLKSPHRWRFKCLATTSTWPIIFSRFFYYHLWWKWCLCLSLWGHWLRMSGFWWCFHSNWRVGVGARLSYGCILSGEGCVVNVRRIG